MIGTSARSAPELWLFFKTSAAAEPADVEQTSRVAEFRTEVERDEIAFYKTFNETSDFATLLRPRLLEEVLDRSGLTRTEIGGVAIDWSASYAYEPVTLVRNGRDRKTLADELAKQQPAEAAPLYTALAEELEALGLTDEANDLRVSACRALLDAGHAEEAVVLLRRVLGVYVWWLRLDEVEYVLRGLSEVLPPEFESERRAWVACATAAYDPIAAAADLQQALEQPHAFSLDPASEGHWRALRWRCLLDYGEAAQILGESGSSGLSSELALELQMIRADALRACHDATADSAWLELRRAATASTTEQPERAAWISTRMAYDLVAQERLPEAEAAYADAASRWGSAPAGQEQAAQAFFSAQAATRLHDPWSFRGWSWRRLAAEQRSSTRTFARRANELEDRAAALRLDGKPDEAAPLLVVARWCHRRAGLLHGVLRDISLLGDLEGERDNYAVAVRLHCRAANVQSAEKLAQKAAQAARRAVADGLQPGEWPSWTTQARCSALAQSGRSASPEVANALAPVVIAALQDSGKRLDNTPGTAASALAELALAVTDPDVRADVLTALESLTTNDRYALAQAGRSGMRMLSDTGEHRFDARLIAGFASDSRHDEPDVRWVAGKLSDGASSRPVVDAALRGEMRPLLALIWANRLDDDPRLRELCRLRTIATLSADLGMTPNGEGMHGLLALNANGEIANATKDLALIASLAERLLVYALETRWPINNRASAVAGLWAMRKHLDPGKALDQLRPLAAPEADLDDDAGHAGLALFAVRGQLEATALQVCAYFASKVAGAKWVDATIAEAALDERDPLREAAWRIAGTNKAWFDGAGARHAMLDRSGDVRAAAVDAWRQQAQTPLPGRSLQRLLADPSDQVLFELIELLTEQPDKTAIAALSANPDAYVRGVAREHLVSASVDTS